METPRPLELVKDLLGVPLNIGRFVADQLQIKGWSELPADPNGKPLGASITIYEGEDNAEH